MVSFSFAGKSFTSVITKDGSNGGESALGPLSDCRYDNILWTWSRQTWLIWSGEGQSSVRIVDCPPFYMSKLVFGGPSHLPSIFNVYSIPNWKYGSRVRLSPSPACWEIIGMYALKSLGGWWNNYFSTLVCTCEWGFFSGFISCLCTGSLIPRPSQVLKLHLKMTGRAGYEAT